MRVPFPQQIKQRLKWLVPESFFGRAMLILLVPMLIMQAVSTYVFFNRHLENVSRYLSRSLAGEVAILVNRLEEADAKENGELKEISSHLLGISIQTTEEKNWDKILVSHDKRFEELQAQLGHRLQDEFKISAAPEDELQIAVAMPTQVIIFRTSMKRVTGSAHYLFVGWMMGTGFFFIIIATLFLRGQVRPIVALARAAGSFGRGEDSPDFKPQGAREVKLAGRAFVTMKERIQRLLRTRVDMLAGISHDLRTPISRMKLQLAMMKTPEAEELQTDLSQMERMIAEYLDFARGAGGEEAQMVNINALLQDVVEDYRRAGASVKLDTPGEILLPLKSNAFRRAITNLIDNALRYGKVCELSVAKNADTVCLMVDDDGPGIAPADRDAVFQPFTRLDPSRNFETGGVGLGLTIVRDIVLAHGGEIALDTSEKNGLRVVIKLPV